MTDAATIYPKVWSATELMGTSFPEPKFAVPGIIPEGLTLLCATPKFGKSWFVLAAGIAVANGGDAFGKVKVDPGPVLYLALEDTPRRLKGRLRMLLDGGPVPEGLNIVTDWDPVVGMDMVNHYLETNPDTRMVVVDVLAKTRPPAINGENLYNADYRAAAAWKDIADEHGIAVVVVHHTRKAASEDFLDAVSGTQGLAGAADAVIVLRRTRGSADAELLLTGRDVIEATFAMRFDTQSGNWALLDGPAEVHALPDTRRRIAELLGDHQPRTPKQIAEVLDGISYDLVKKTCQRMLDADQLDNAEGYYTLSPLSPLSPQRDGGDTRDTPTEGHLEVVADA